MIIIDVFISLYTKPKLMETHNFCSGFRNIGKKNSFSGKVSN